MDWDFFGTEGRLRRLHYLAYLFILTIASGVVQLVCDALLPRTVAGIFGLALNLPIWWSTYCVAVRRAHDVGFGGAVIIVAAVAFLVGMILVVWGVYMIATGMPGSGSTVSLGLVLVCVQLVLSLVLLVAPPDSKDRYGPDPR